MGVEQNYTTEIFKIHKFVRSGRFDRTADRTIVRGRTESLAHHETCDGLDG